MNTISQSFPKTGRISGPEVGDGAKPDVPTTDRQNEKNTRNFQKFLNDDGKESLRTAFGFEYLISLRAEHSDADRDSKIFKRRL